MGVDYLVCGCGMRLKTAGAVPGRVGQCPRCGSFLKVPDPPKVSNQVLRSGGGGGHATFVENRERNVRSVRSMGRISDGLVRPPASPETRYVVSLFYPLWNASGISVLGFVPLGLWLATVPLFGLLPASRLGSGFGLLLLIPILPQIFLLTFVGGNLLRFLSQVLVTSSLGEVTQPRGPTWNLTEIATGLMPWAWASLIGLGIGGLPALLYWIQCGDVDWLDRIILVDLIVPGLGYAQMALLASVMFESPLAANPITIVRAIRHAGWSYVAPCLESGVATVLLGALFAGVLEIRDGLVQSVAYWFFWLCLIYVAMVVLRRLGLYCYREAVVLEWFPDRGRSAR